MSATEFHKIFADPALKQEAQVRGRQLAATAQGNTATRINSLDVSRVYVVPAQSIPPAPTNVPAKTPAR
jgi:hypothetical protein